MTAGAIVLVVLAAVARPDVPHLFAPGVISTSPLAESGGTFSADGNEFYFTARTPTTTSTPLSVICVSHRIGGKWTQPEVASFSGISWDAAPAMTQDGHRLFFVSTRHADASRQDTDIWYVDREAGGWSEPVNLGETVNTAADEQTPSLAADDTLYFASSRPGGKGSTDLYRSHLVAGNYTAAENLAEINTEAVEVAPFIDPAQRFILFASVGRPDMLLAGGRPYARADLYVSFFREGHWAAAQRLPSPINTVASETYPFLSRDGQSLYFTSEREPFVVPVTGLTTKALAHAWSQTENGLSNIYVVTTPDILRPGN